MMKNYDWASLMPEVARLLLPEEPTSKTAQQWRYGSKGSLAVYLDKGTWHCFEAGNGGGVLDLIKRELKCTQATALDWLRNQGLLPEKSPHRTPATTRLASPPAAPHGKTPKDNEAERGALAGRVWSAARPADRTPARIYLSRRWAWPPFGIGPTLPGALRWLSRNQAPGPMKKAGWYGLPGGAAGALVFAYRHRATGELQAVALEALDERGRRLDQAGGKRWRRCYGPRRGCSFRPVSRPGSKLLLVEGELDALASIWLFPEHEPHATGGGGLRGFPIGNRCGSARTRTAAATGRRFSLGKGSAGAGSA